MRTWVDASTVIALDAIGEVALLRELLGRVSLTREVAEEVFRGRESRTLREARGSWIEVRAVRGGRGPWVALGLDRGEASLFLTPKSDRLVVDERAARTVAAAEGRDFVGLLGLLVEATGTGRLQPTRARRILERLVGSGFYVATPLYKEARDALGAGDAPDGGR